MLLFNLHVNKVRQLSKISLLFTILILSTFLTVGYFYRQSPFRFVYFAAAQTEEGDQHNERQDGDDVLPTVNDLQASNISCIV